jgi:copper chaperone
MKNLLSKLGLGGDENPQVDPDMPQGDSMMQFKTNLRCGACVQTVEPFMDRIDGVERWDVNLNDPDRILSVYGTTAPELVKAALSQAGYSAEIMPKK